MNLSVTENSRCRESGADSRLNGGASGGCLSGGLALEICCLQPPRFPRAPKPLATFTLSPRTVRILCYFKPDQYHATITATNTLMDCT